jgi:hypothetical protein
MTNIAIFRFSEFSSLGRLTAVYTHVAICTHTSGVYDHLCRTSEISHICGLSSFAAADHCGDFLCADSFCIVFLSLSSIAANQMGWHLWTTWWQGLSVCPNRSGKRQHSAVRIVFCHPHSALRSQCVAGPRSVQKKSFLLNRHPFLGETEYIFLGVHGDNNHQLVIVVVVVIVFLFCVGCSLCVYFVYCVSFDRCVILYDVCYLCVMFYCSTTATR